MNQALATLGWSASLEEAFEPWRLEGLVAGRIAVEHRSGHQVFTSRGEVAADLAGRLRHSNEIPAVGDWVALRVPPGGRARIEAVLPRRTRLARKAAGASSEEQVLAANVDVALLVASLNADLSVRRLERLLALVTEGGVRPAIVLSKADLSEDPLAEQSSLEHLAVPVHVVSAARGEGLDALAPYFGPGTTTVLLGSSGVGKSTIVNALLGAPIQAVLPIRDDDTGRHTTTSRQLLPLPTGGLVLDTPGLREVGLALGDLSGAFPDIEALAASCRFRDCAHETEPGCAVLARVEAGDLDADVLESWRSLGRELRSAAIRRDARARIEARRRWKSIARNVRAQRRLEDL